MFLTHKDQSVSKIDDSSTCKKDKNRVSSFLFLTHVIFSNLLAHNGLQLDVKHALTRFLCF